MTGEDAYREVVKFARRRLVQALNESAAPPSDRDRLLDVDWVAERRRWLDVASQWAACVAALDTGSPAGWARDLG